MGGTDVTMLRYGKALFFGNSQILDPQNHNQSNQNVVPMSPSI